MPGEWAFMARASAWRGCLPSSTGPAVRVAGRDWGFPTRPHHGPGCCSSSTSQTRHVASSTSMWQQDRVLADGAFVPAPSPPVASPLAPAHGRVPSFVPAAPPVAPAALQALEDFVAAHPGVLVVTGAGVSTESRIPDYRSPAGAYSTGFKPMTHQQFMGSAAARARYWARSFAGWYRYAGVRPNAAHEGLAALQRRGWLGGILTQNVDRLHHAAGSGDVLELHGTTHAVRCMGCGAVTPRVQTQARLAELNPEVDALARALAGAGEGDEDPPRHGVDGDRSIDDRDEAFRGREDGSVRVPVRRPDGDVELEDAGSGFRVPPCPACGGILKPDVVFFGDSVPKDVAARAQAAAAACPAMLVVGSSLQVWSAFRLARAAKAAGAPLALLSVGPNRADDLADLKVEARAGEVLARLARSPRLLLPHVP
ncbi:SRTB1 [Auxenochlorella protothecoides x Auxenochlorella symbiontica]